MTLFFHLAGFGSGRSFLFLHLAAAEVAAQNTFGPIGLCFGSGRSAVWRRAAFFRDGGGGGRGSNTFGPIGLCFGSGRSAVWQRAAMGRRRSQVQILSARPLPFCC